MYEIRMEDDLIQLWGPVDGGHYGIDAIVCESLADLQKGIDKLKEWRKSYTFNLKYQISKLRKHLTD